MKNIYIIGAQSTGKTTLVDACERHFQQQSGDDTAASSSPPLIIREVARSILEGKDFTRDDLPTSPERCLQLQQLILHAQHDAETIVPAAKKPRWYICDRSGLDPIVYAEFFVGPDAAEVMLKSNQWLELEERMKNGVIILCEPNAQWLVDDGLRSMPKNFEEWAHVHDTFRKLLAARNISYTSLTKDVQDIAERVQYVLNISNQELPATP